jgi:hypothetical protein
MGVLVICAGGVTYDRLKPLVPRILQALEAVKPGKMIEIE